MRQKVHKVGSSRMIVIPKVIIDSLKLDEKDEVELEIVKLKDGEVVIRLSVV